MFTLHYKPEAQKQISKLDKFARNKIILYLESRVAKNPRKFGKALSANLAGYWRYRVGDHRIICEIKNKELIVFVIEIGHRREIYEK